MKAVVENLKLEVAAKITRDFNLQVSREEQVVTVEANGIQINTVDAAVSTVVNRQFVENMPLNGRSFQSLLTLAPGVTAVVSRRGQGQRFDWYRQAEPVTSPVVPPRPDSTTIRRCAG